MSEMSTQRKLYLFAAVCFAIGAVIALFTAEWTALFVFLVLLGTMLWIQARIDKLMADRHPDDVAHERERRARRGR